MNLVEYIFNTLKVDMPPLVLNISDNLFAIEKFILINHPDKYQELYKTCAKYLNIEFKELPTDLSINTLILSFDQSSENLVVITNDRKIFTANNDIDKIKQLLQQKDIQDYEIFFTNRKSLTQLILDSYCQIDCDYKTKNIIPKNKSSITTFGKGQIIVVLALLLCLVVSLTIYPLETIIYVLLFINLIYISEILFKLVVFITGVFSQDEVDITGNQELNDIYSILIPLYKEDQMLSNLNDNLQKIDYPKHLLDIKIILEQDDFETIDKAFKIFPQYVDILVMPTSYPKTKPKALNLSFRFVKGKFITIYDAEDNFEHDQLKKAVAVLKDKVVCAQSILRIHSYHQSLISYWFYIEYEIWFGYIRKGIDKLKMPMPLGGTSNHFVTEKLKEIGIWDAYNVTEDAELGVRIAQHGYQTKMIPSITYEESVSEVTPWIKQRTRWIKGFCQTYLVHTRNIFKTIKSLGIKNFIGFQILIGFQSASFVITPIIIYCWWHYHNSIGAMPEFLSDLSFINFILSVLVNFICALVIVLQSNYIKKKNFDAVITYPIYFVLHWFAGIRALYQLIFSPHYWDKTTHHNKR